MESNTFQSAQQVLMLTVICWTFVGAIVFSTTALCLSLVGLVEFKDKAQQKHLFYLILAKASVVGLLAFKSTLVLNPKAVGEQFQHLTIYDYWKSFNQDGVKAMPSISNTFPKKFGFKANGIEGELTYIPELNVYLERNWRSRSAPKYHYYFRPIKIDANGEYLIAYDDYRSVSIGIPKDSGVIKFCGSGVDGAFTDLYSAFVLEM